MTTGQVCMAIKRLYVPRSRYDDVVDGLRAALPGQSRRLRTQPRGDDGAAQHGPPTRLRRRVGRGGAGRRRRGDRAAASTSTRDRRMATTRCRRSCSTRRSDLRVVTEEQFGPTLPVIPYDTEEQAIALANDTWAGLCSSVWSGDDEHAMAVARQLRTGVTFFNNHNATAVDERAPFGGFNQSGVGRELGREGLFGFTETHVMAVPDGSAATRQFKSSKREFPNGCVAALAVTRSPISLHAIKRGSSDDDKPRNRVHRRRLGPAPSTTRTAGRPGRRPSARPPSSGSRPSWRSVARRSADWSASRTARR